MKKLFILFIAVALFMSCEKQELLNSFQQREVPILLKGDYVTMSASPLTRGSNSKKYFAFEIDSVKIDSTKRYNDPFIGLPPYYFIYDTTYCHYAGGVFVDIENLGINLEKGHKYRIRCSIIEDREDHLYVDNGYVFEPFVAPGYGDYGTKAKINNAFVYGGTKEVYAYNPASYICTVEDDKNMAAKVNRYYGEIMTDTIDDNSPISLDMERKNFGLHFLLTPPKEGVLQVCNTYGNPKYEYILDSNSSSIDEEYVYALKLGHTGAGSKPQIKWTRADGEVVDLSPGNVMFYIKTMTTIKVDVNDRIGNSDVYINLDSEMTQDDIVIK